LPDASEQEADDDAKKPMTLDDFLTALDAALNLVTVRQLMRKYRHSIRKPNGSAKPDHDPGGDRRSPRQGGSVHD
jgi:hypothetical protein